MKSIVKRRDPNRPQFEKGIWEHACALLKDYCFALTGYCRITLKNGEQILMIGLQTVVRCSCVTDNFEKKFCTECGKQSKYDCKEYKKPVAIAEKFCGTCGTKNPHYDVEAYSTRPR